MRRFMRRKGQSAMYDGMLFFVLMLISSGIVMITTLRASNETNVNESAYLSEYADATLYSILKSTINYTYYYDSTGTVLKQINRTNKMVSELLLEDISVRYSDNTPDESLTEVFEKSIKDIVDAATYPEYRYSLVAQYQDVSLEIKGKSVGALPAERHASYMELAGIEPIEGKVAITLYVWRR